MGTLNHPRLAPEVRDRIRSRMLAGTILNGKGCEGTSGLQYSDIPVGAIKLGFGVFTKSLLP